MYIWQSKTWPSFAFSKDAIASRLENVLALQKQLIGHAKSLPENLDREAESVISWWKLKYRNNRAIRVDDAKAQKDIMREIKKRAAVRKSTIPNENIIATIEQSAKEAKDDLVAIYQVDAKHFISFYRYNEEFEFVNEKRWVISRGKLKVELNKSA